MALFLGTVAVSYPLWVRIAAKADKRTIFLLGAASWIASSAFLLFASPATRADPAGERDQGCHARRPDVIRLE